MAAFGGTILHNINGQPLRHKGQLNIGDQIRLHVYDVNNRAVIKKLRNKRGVMIKPKTGSKYFTLYVDGKGWCW